MAELVRRLEARNARLYLPRGDWDYAVSAGLRMLTLRHLVDEQDGLYRARAERGSRCCATTPIRLPTCWPAEADPGQGRSLPPAA